jgi:SAM-dependent methyltransferase
MAEGKENTADAWRQLNRANWDERVAVHLGPRGYDFDALREGWGHLPIVEDELGAVAGLNVLHLQCHIGTDSLALAQRGAAVVGLDFSAPAVEAARALAVELGLAERVRIVQADVYDAPAAIRGAACFDLVFTTWGTIVWLPDIRAWAKIVAHFLKPGGTLYFADGHPAALAFDQRLGFETPYFGRTALVIDNPRDYADPDARLSNATTHEWLHPLSDVVSAVIAAGLRLEWLHEHAAVPWRMFDCLIRSTDGLYRWPDKPWLPLAWSFKATRP